MCAGTAHGRTATAPPPDPVSPSPLCRIGFIEVKSTVQGRPRFKCSLTSFGKYIIGPAAHSRCRTFRHPSSLPRQPLAARARCSAAARATSVHLWTGIWVVSISAHTVSGWEAGMRPRGPGRVGPAHGQSLWAQGSVPPNQPGGGGVTTAPEGRLGGFRPPAGLQGTRPGGLLGGKRCPTQL